MPVQNESPRNTSNNKFVILETAKQLFAKHGFAATSISQIAKQAKINQSLIYHYYENKADLWKAVKEYLVEQFQKQHHSSYVDLLQIKDVKKFIRAFVTHRFEFYDSNVDFRRIIAWQKLESEDGLLFGNRKSDFNDFIGHLEWFQQQGQIAATVNIKHFIVMLLSLATEGHAFARRLQTMDNHTSKQEYLDLVIKTLCDVIRL